MSGGLIALIVALAAASVLGLVFRRVSGRFRGTTKMPAGTVSASTVSARDVLTATDLGGRLGERATLVQFSTEFCAQCRPARRLLTEVAGTLDGVTHVEIDAAERLDLVRRLRISSTPTVLVLGPDGTIAQRASGLPRKADVLAALGTVTGSGVPAESEASP